MAKGVTATEFAAMCQKHMQKYMPKSLPSKFPTSTAKPFLDRCCELGLLRRENVNGTTRYFPTSALSTWGQPDD
jgi:hypothetical protein